MPRLGKMNRRITIWQQSASTRNAMNEPVRGWTRLDSFWAEEDERAAKGTEGVQAGQVRAQLHRVWRIRWTQRTATISELDRVMCGGVEYEIVSAIEKGRRDHIQITAIGPVLQPAVPGA